MKFTTVVAGAVIVQCLMSLGWTTANADQILTYTGNPFTRVNSPYTTSDEVLATIDLSTPLGNSVTDMKVTPKSFTLMDGQQTITQATPNLSTELFEFSTNPSGQITLWTVEVSVGSGARIDTLNNGSVNTEDAGEQATGIVEITGTCPAPIIVVFGAAGTNACQAGAWTSTSVAAPEPPTVTVLGVGLLGLGLLWWRRRQNRDFAQ